MSAATPSFVVEDQSSAIAAMEDPATIGASAVERIDTHGAIVFLAGDRVFKMKRAVRFPFMDFGTASRRRDMCVAEVVVNRRFTPQLYLGVAPLDRHGQRWTLGDVLEPDACRSGSADEWLVVMRRFDQDSLLSRRAEQGHLEAATLVELAQRIATAHDASTVSRDYAGAVDYRRSIATDIEQMRTHAGLLDPAVTEELAAALPGALEPLVALVDRRRDAGAVRRCHGDLHLRNVCLLDGQPALFDAIEFNDRIATIDVLYDLAFLLMDLMHRGHRDFANLVLNNWLWRVGDVAAAPHGEALALLPMFLSRRAAIRAHVDAAAAELRDTAVQDEVRAAVRLYQRESASYLHPVPPRLLAIGGLSGSGKTTIAMQLAPDTDRAPGAVVVRSDVERKRLSGITLTERLPAGSYTQEASDAVYARVLAQAAQTLAAGQSVIVDAVFSKPAERDAVAALGRRLGVPFAGLWLDIARDVALQRVSDRRGDASDAGVAVVERQQGYDLGRIDWARLDSSGPPAVVAAAARRVLSLEGAAR